MYEQVKIFVKGPHRNAKKLDKEVNDWLLAMGGNIRVIEHSSTMVDALYGDSYGRWRYVELAIIIRFEVSTKKALREVGKIQRKLDKAVS